MFITCVFELAWTSTSSMLAVVVPVVKISCYFQIDVLYNQTIIFKQKNWPGNVFI